MLLPTHPGGYLPLSKIPRNAPCPCGSGRKFKRCCLPKLQRRTREASLHQTGTEVVLSWLSERHGSEILEDGLYGEFLGGLEEEEYERLREGPENVWEMVFLNGMEYLLAEAELCEEGMPSFRARDVVFAPGGPILDLEQRRFLKEIFSRPLSVYEVVAAYPGEGLELRDLVAPDEPNRFVIEKSASQSLKAGMVFATRLLDLDGWEMSAAVYPFAEPRVPEVLEVVREWVEESQEVGEDPRYARSTAIIDEWLRALTAPLPELVDRGSGEPILLITDHYEILDRDGLGRAMDEQPDVESNGARGWALLEPGEAETRRTLLALNLDPARPDRLEAFTQTQRKADEGRRWLEACAAASLRHITREVVDPLGAMEGGAVGPAAGPASPAELMAQLPEGFFQKLMEDNYRGWADEPIPALKNQTPRRAIQTSRGRRQVIELLESYERGDRQQARAEGRDPVDFSFLWTDLDLPRPE